MFRFVVIISIFTSLCGQELRSGECLWRGEAGWTLRFAFWDGWRLDRLPANQTYTAIDDDNEVTLLDFGELVAAFGSIPGDPNWNPNADLDGDLEVTLFDFGILVQNFGEIGEE